MAESLQESDDILKDDYYSLLNVSREASKGEINQAYKQLSKIYHPDKHQDPIKKKNAIDLFSKLKRAHEVLVDDHLRVIYNLYGEKGLESYGMEVVSRTKTPAEIIAEYERYQQELEEETLQKCTRPETVSSVTIDATTVFDTQEYVEDEFRPGVVERVSEIGISSMNLSQSVICPLTSKDTGILAWRVGMRNGNGAGTFTTVWRRFLTNRDTIRIESTFGNMSGLTFQYSRNLFKSIWIAVKKVTVTSADPDQLLLPCCLVRISAGRYRLFKFNAFSLQRKNKGIGIGTNAELQYSFDRHWVGKIQWNLGLVAPSSLNTMLVYNSETQQIHMEVSLQIYESYVFASYTRKFVEHGISAKVSLKAGQFGYNFEYGLSKKISKFSTLGATMSIGIPSGVAVKLKLHRGSHTIHMPIILSEEIVPSAVLYGTVLPLITYYTVKKLIVDPFLSSQRQKDIERKKKEQKEKIQKRKQEAHALIELMKETVERNIEQEERKNGLIIITAVYGRLSSGQQEDLQTEDCIDVTVPLQALVKDSNLITPDNTTKSDLPGFYDPCIGEEKSLYIKYKFRKKIHHITVKDLEKIRIPQQRHLVREEELSMFNDDND